MPDVLARTQFPHTLQSYMNHFQMSQVDVAKHLNVSKQTVSDWINGKKYPGVNNMQALANLFGVYISDMQKPYSEVSSILRETSLDDSELKLLDLWRGAEDDARKYALQILANNQKKDMLSKAK